ncbi:hypothetical protein HS088_TW17G00831 [Tripterygium wilfordii]|uniref:Uncharacterized protein n=1 Tax=Tripterygium wilfordii TaxID=458696 RepID=A0A7J7CGY7_TRIWF|nr:hypothetical protein HS088_TW17G00831 [Tripterygium wilfordii]
MGSSDDKGGSSDDKGGPSTPFRSFGLSMFRSKREQGHSMEGTHESRDQDVESFQKQVTERFHELSIVSVDGLLSVEWIKKLLDAFMSCQEEFRVILLKNKDQVLKSPLDSMISEFFERSVKALDICNATRDGIEKLRLWQKQLEIVQEGNANSDFTHTLHIYIISLFSVAKVSSFSLNNSVAFNPPSLSLWFVVIGSEFR